MTIYLVALSSSPRHKAHIMMLDAPATEIRGSKTVCGMCSPVWQLYLDIKDQEPRICARCRKKVGLE